MLYNHFIRGESFILNQDLMDWLKSDKTDEKNFSGTGLLLAPMDSDTQNINIEEEVKKPRPQLQLPAVLEPSIEDFIIHVSDDDNDGNFENEIKFEEIEIENSEPELNIESDIDIGKNETDEAKNNPELENNVEEIEIEKIESENKSEAESASEHQELEDFSNKISELNQTLQEIQNIFEAQHEPEETQSEQQNNVTENENEKDKEWQQHATGFELSLDEPPPELWTRITQEEYEAENNEEEDEELDYEQGMSLQGAAYVPKAPKGAPGRGQNFTERLHQSLRGRKQRAEQLREQQEENKPKHPYRSKAFIICATLLMLLGVAYLALWFIQRWTPEKIYERANSRLEIGDYEGAMNLFYRGYKRYPNVLTFLTGLAKAAESADNNQTAISALESYINFLPKDDNENRNSAQLELRRLKGEPEPEPEPVMLEPDSVPEEISESPQIIAEELEEEEKIETEEPEPDPTSSEKIEPETEPIHEEKTPEQPKKLPAAFYEFLNEANEAYNSKLYDTAIIYFNRAIELDTVDIRAYIGLANAYKAKGMFFDAKRILDEAKKKFNKNSTVETQLKILELEGD